MPEHFELDLKEIFEALLKKAWIIILIAIVVSSATYMVSRFVVSPQYTSSISLHVNNSPETLAMGTIGLADINAAQRLVNTYIVILQDDYVLDQLGNQLLAEFGEEWLAYFVPLNRSSGHTRVDTDALRRMISMSSVNNTEVLRIQAQTRSALLSARICTIMTEIAPDVLIRVVGAGSVEVIGTARVPDDQSSPRVLFNSIIGLIVGIALAVVIVLLRHLFDNTIKDEEGLKRRFNIPVLGEIPDFTTARKGGARYAK
ncbi:MAG: Wzz/FepE/Etk N-terminal domain-containing protein [Oscillospiraceae bacterium]|nr:Wzz/FepE/Etk N-terminal domain-containing protein [Oscillospiraceae bacterium]